MRRLFICLFIPFALMSQAQDSTVTFTVNTVYDFPNGIAESTVYVENFIDIISMQFTLQYSPTDIETPGLIEFNLPPFYNSVNSHFGFPEPGYITFSWINPFEGPIDINYGPIFSFQFEIKSNGAGPVCINGSQTAIEVAKIINGGFEIISPAFQCNTDVPTLSGKVFGDDDDDCQMTAGESGLASWKVIAEQNGIQYFSPVKPDGSYRFFLDPGTYDISYHAPIDLWEKCENTTAINVDEETSTALNLGAQPVILCPVMQVDISTPILRRCFENTYYVDYCNLGTDTGGNAYIDVSLDSYLEFLSSSIPSVSLSGNVYRFYLGDVAAGDCGSFTFNVMVNCDNTVIGQTHCVEAHIYPDYPCETLPAWSGATLRVNGSCDGSSVFFDIINDGTADMPGHENYIILEDALVLQESSLQLAAGESTRIELPANGSTYRIQLEQVPFHPTDGNPTAAVEGCGTNSQGTFSTGFVTQFPNSDDPLFIDVDCQENVGSWDPNDIQVFPKGYDTPGYVEANTDLEYLIRFQNTGTDTAFNIYILDTLAAHLDIASIQPGVSSHPYVFDILGSNVLRFRFNNIYLPDSIVNEAASHGFVRYRISQLPDLQPETEIKNKASIYFDFNPAVVTNTVLNTIGEELLHTGTQHVFEPGAEVMVFPNPFHENVTFEINGLLHNGGEVRIFDIAGMELLRKSFGESRFEVQTQALPQGLYFYKIYQHGNAVVAGKLVRK